MTHRVVAAALRRDGRVLLGHRSPDRQWYPDVWDFPGDHIEDGETPQEALVREVREELGVELLALADPVATFTLPDTELGVWLVEDWIGTIKNRCPDEHDDLRWFTAAEVQGRRLADDGYLALIDRLLPQAC